MKITELEKLIYELLLVEEKLDKIYHTNIYGNYEYIYHKDLDKSFYYLNKERQLKKQIKEIIGLWNYLLLLFNRRYFYRKFKLIK